MVLSLQTHAVFLSALPFPACEDCSHSCHTICLSEACLQFSRIATRPCSIAGPSNLKYSYAFTVAKIRCDPPEDPVLRPADVLLYSTLSHCAPHRGTSFCAPHLRCLPLASPFVTSSSTLWLQVISGYRSPTLGSSLFLCPST